jgi:hypothetical protein
MHYRRRRQLYRKSKEIGAILTRSIGLGIESAVFLGKEELGTVLGPGSRRETEGVIDWAGMPAVETEGCVWGA